MMYIAVINATDSGQIECASDPVKVWFLNVRFSSYFLVHDNSAPRLVTTSGLLWSYLLLSYLKFQGHDYRSPSK